MVEKFNFEGKYKPEDRKFFSNLAKKYGLEETSEHLVLERDGEKRFIPKWRKIPLKSKPEGMSLELYIKKVIAEFDEKFKKKQKNEEAA